MRVKRSNAETMWSKQFGDKLRRLIHIRGMTQGQFARALGVREETVSRYVTGTCYPSPYVIKQIVDILDCDVSQLFDVAN